MRTTLLRSILLPALLANLLANSSAFAQQDLLSALESSPLPLRSRTCGLVLLSNGRAQVRAGDPAAAQVQLTRAFALLQDGRALVDKSKARVFSDQLLHADAAVTSLAMSRCQAWLTARLAASDFDKTEESQWSWAQQAVMTQKIERP